MGSLLSSGVAAWSQDIVLHSAGTETVSSDGADNSALLDPWVAVTGGDKKYQCQDYPKAQSRLCQLQEKDLCNAQHQSLQGNIARSL